MWKARVVVSAKCPSACDVHLTDASDAKAVRSHVRPSSTKLFQVGKIIVFDTDYRQSLHCRITVLAAYVVEHQFQDIGLYYVPTLLGFTQRFLLHACSLSHGSVLLSLL